MHICIYIYAYIQIYILIYDHFWGTKTETHGRTHSFGRRLAIFE